MRANLVGRSVVSAITHTPASGPFTLVTTPPISSGSIGTGAAAPLCRATTHVIEQATRMATTSAVRLPLVMIPLSEFPGGFLLRTQTFAGSGLPILASQKPFHR